MAWKVGGAGFVQRDTAVLVRLGQRVPCPSSPEVGTRLTQVNTIPAESNTSTTLFSPLVAANKSPAQIAAQTQVVHKGSPTKIRYRHSASWYRSALRCSALLGNSEETTELRGTKSPNARARRRVRMLNG